MEYSHFTVWFYVFTEFHSGISATEMIRKLMSVWENEELSRATIRCINHRSLMPTKCVERKTPVFCNLKWTRRLSQLWNIFGNNGGNELYECIMGLHFMLFLCFFLQLLRRHMTSTDFGGPSRSWPTRGTLQNFAALERRLKHFMSSSASSMFLWIRAVLSLYLFRPYIVGFVVRDLGLFSLLIYVVLSLQIA